MILWCGYKLQVFAHVLFAANVSKWTRPCASTSGDVLVHGAFGPCDCAPTTFAGVIISVNGESTTPPRYTRRTLQVGAGAQGKLPYGAVTWIDQGFHDHPRPVTEHAVAYVNSNCVPERERMADHLSRHVPVVALGRCKGTSNTIRHAPHRGHWVDNRQLLTGYAYVIAAEHGQVAGYVSEKAFVAIAAGAVPIYWGDAALARRYIHDNAMLVWNESTVDIVPPGVNYVYVVGAGPPVPNAIVLTRPENMNTGKSFEWLRAAPTLFPSATHIFKMDTDVAICPRTLEHMLLRTLQSNPDYVGRPHNHSTCGGFAHCPEKHDPSWMYMYGSLYGLSMEAATCLRDRYTGPVTGHEDLMVGKALFKSACVGVMKRLPCLCQDTCAEQCPAWHMYAHKHNASRPLCGTGQPPSRQRRQQGAQQAMK
eukprot:gene5533-789_t